MTAFIFATGIENSYPTIQNGRVRIYEMEKCGHYQNWRRDFDCLQELGIEFLRYGPPIHTTWVSPERQDGPSGPCPHHVENCSRAGERDLTSNPIVWRTEPISTSRL